MTLYYKKVEVSTRDKDNIADLTMSGLANFIELTQEYANRPVQVLSLLVTIPTNEKYMDVALKILIFRRTPPWLARHQVAKRVAASSSNS